MLKNIIIAALATAIYHANIVPGIMLDKKVFATGCAFVFVVVAMNSFDFMIRKIKRHKVHTLSNRAFNNYKAWLDANVLQKKAQGKDETYRMNLVMNVITHNRRYAFSGRQISELLDLATTEQKEKSASVGKP